MKVRGLIYVVSIVFALLGTWDASYSAGHCQGRKSLEPKDGLVCLLVNRNSGRCLSVAASSVDPGARIVQGPMPAQAGASEQWKLLASGEAHRLRNEKSGLILEIGSKNMNKGVQAIQWHEQKDFDNQQWIFEPVDDSYVLRVKHSQLVLGVAQSNLEDGARVIQWTYVPNVSDQMWQLRATKAEDEPAEEPAVNEQAAATMDGWLIGVLVCTGSAILLGFAGGTGIVLYLRRRSKKATPVTQKTEEHKAPEHSQIAKCPGCGLRVKVKTGWVGKKVKCAKCGAAVQA
jgi:hypothetical protein